MNITRKQFIRAKRKVVVDFVGFNLIGTLLGVFSMWVTGSIIAWGCHIGGWSLVGRHVFALAAFAWWVFITTNLVRYSYGCLLDLKKVDTQDELDAWCRKYYFRYVK
jgi:hypothetical protein